MDDSVVIRSGKALNGFPKMDKGNMPADGGYLILTEEDKDRILESNPTAKNFIRKFIGSQEFIRGVERWCLWISDDKLKEAKAIPEIKERLDLVSKFRSQSTKQQTVELASSPHQFGEIRHEEAEGLIIPSVASEDREYITVGFFDGTESVISNACFTIFGSFPHIFSILSSKLHSVWIKSVCGRLKIDIRYSNTMGYYTFPTPQLSEAQREELEIHAWNIVAARESNVGKTIAWMYNPETMPPNIKEAHHNLDKCLERFCIGREFKSDTERLEYLFKQYTNLKRNGIDRAEPELNLRNKKK
jgi:hypothetical protein